MSNGGGTTPSGSVEVIADIDVEIINQPFEGDVSVEDEDVLTTIVTGDQGPPGPRGNSVLYGTGGPPHTYGINGDFYIDLNTALMYGPKASGTWPPGFSLIGPIGPQGIPGPPGPIGAPGNTIRSGSGPPDPALGVPGDFYIDTTNHNIYGPKSATVVNWGSPSSIVGPVGPPGPTGVSGPPPWSTPPTPWAAHTGYTVGPPASLVTANGASYVPTAGHTSGVDFATDLAAGLWALVAAAGSPGGLSAQIYVGDSPPTGVPNNTLWWNSTDGCAYLYYFDGDSHQWVIISPVPDISLYLPLTGGTLTGPLVLAGDPTATNQAATKHYVDVNVAGGAVPEAPNDGVTYGRKSISWTPVVPLSGGVTMTGFLTLNANPTATNHAANKAYVDSKVFTDAPADGFDYGRANGAWDKVVPLAGGTMTGLLTLSGAPSSALHAATKAYADTKLSDAPSDGNTYARKNAGWVTFAAGANVYVQDTAPTGVTAGSLWWQSSTGLLFVYYNDGTSSQWVYASSVATTTVVRSYLAGLTLSTAGSSATFSVAAGQCADSSNSDMLNLVSALSKTTSAWAVGSGTGGLDTGAIAVNTWYHVYLIKRIDTQVVDVLVSLSPSAPTLPANYTLFRRIGAMKTNASSQWKAFNQRGDEFLWAEQLTQDVNVSNLGATPTLYTMATVPSGIQVVALFRGSMQNAAANAITISSPDELSVAINVPTGNLTISSAAGLTVDFQLQLRTNTSQQIRAVSLTASTTFFIVPYGWIDSRGRDL